MASAALHATTVSMMVQGLELGACRRLRRVGLPDEPSGSPSVRAHGCGRSVMRGGGVTWNAYGQSPLGLAVWIVGGGLCQPAGSGGCAGASVPSSPPAGIMGMAGIMAGPILGPGP